MIIEIAKISVAEKNTLNGQFLSARQKFHPMQDRNYDWFISKEEIANTIVVDFLFVKDLTLSEYENYIESDIFKIAFNISTNILSLTLFDTLDAPIKELNINTLSSERETTMETLKDDILSVTPDCTNIEFRRRSGVIKITSAGSGVSTSYFPDLSPEDQDTYTDVGDICNELVLE